MLQVYRRCAIIFQAFKPLNEVYLPCRTSQVVLRRSFFRKATKEKKEQEKSRRKEERKQIFGEITKGYFADLREYGESGGKRFFASDTILDEKNAVPFPELHARNLHKRMIKINEEFPDNVTLVLLWLRAIGQNMCEKYREEFMKKFQMHPQVKCYEISVVDGVVFKLMKPFIENSLRKQIVPEKQDCFLSYYGKTETIKKDLVENMIVGHAFLVDGSGRIRWKAHGRPTQQEITFMIDCTEELLKENQKSLNAKYSR